MGAKIDSKDVPQADVLEDVVRVALAVQKGARADYEIAGYIGKGVRQGRYYRRAAQILGFIVNANNTATLTAFGDKFLKSAGSVRRQMLHDVVLNVSVIQRIIPFIELSPKGVKRPALEKFLLEVTTVDVATSHRRIDSIISWLTEFGVLREVSHETYALAGLPKSSPILEVQNVAEPLFPKTGALKEYVAVEEKTSVAKEFITILINEAAAERANAAHRELVNLVADRIEKAGSIPRCNKLIDLSTRRGKTPYIFEMKSITHENARAQIRSGISQLYEYRYLQAVPDATLVLVIEKELPKQLNWMHEYLEKERQIRLIWDGNDSLYASPETKSELSYLWAV
ncbi:MAG: hypothetical protein ACJ74J_05410 [Blastocatellia bacterium]